MENKYSTIIADDPEHEELFIEIYLNDKFVAQISQEKGPDHLEVEFPGPDVVESKVTRVVELNEFIKELDQAAKRLIEF